ISDAFMGGPGVCNEFGTFFADAVDFAESAWVFAEDLYGLVSEVLNDSSCVGGSDTGDMGRRQEANESFFAAWKESIDGECFELAFAGVVSFHGSADADMFIDEESGAFDDDGGPQRLVVSEDDDLKLAVIGFVANGFDVPLEAGFGVVCGHMNSRL